MVVNYILPETNSKFTPSENQWLEDDPASLWVLGYFLIKLLVFREGTILQGGPLPVGSQVITLTGHLEGLVGRDLANTNPPKTEHLLAKVTWKGQKSSFFGVEWSSL